MCTFSSESESKFCFTPWFEKKVAEAVVVSQDPLSTPPWLASFQREREQRLCQVIHDWNEKFSLPSFTYVTIGATARHEDLIDSDLDHALLIDGDSSTFRSVLPELYRECVANGFLLCEGHVMGSNPRWIGSIAAWTERVRSYEVLPSWDSSRYLWMCLDSRPLIESVPGWGELRTRAKCILQSSEFRKWQLVHALEGSAYRWRVGTLLGQRLNVKDHLLGPIIHGARLLSLDSEVDVLSTDLRLRAAVQAGFLHEREELRLLSAYQFFRWLRLRGHLHVLKDLSLPPGDLIAVKSLPPEVSSELRHHLQGVHDFLKLLHHRYPKPR